MSLSVLYTNGVIAVREKYLLKDKLLKLCEMGADDALRAVSESGFGKGAEVSSVYEYEKLIEADEAAIDEFIREYSPSETEKAYLLSARDFHNAKAAVKAIHLNTEVDKLLAPDGLIAAADIVEAVKSGNLQPLGKILAEAVTQAQALLNEEGGDVSGADVGVIFDKALYAHLKKVCATNLMLKKLVAVKADMTNILTALRSGDSEYAAKCYLPGGKLSADKLCKLFDEDKIAVEHALDGTPYAAFLKKCLADRLAGLPLTQAEKVCESYETEYFAARKYELKRTQPFLYYVLRRRAENANVRILFVCLLAGMREQDIKKRMRAF